MQYKTALISIHPEYVAKILTGEKRLEFRRVWAISPVDRLLIYSTTPTKQLVAVAQIKKTFVGTPNALWIMAKKTGGGISRQRLSDYLHGKKRGFAIEISSVYAFENGICPLDIFGKTFRAPQSFRYLKPAEVAKLNSLIKK